MDIELKGHKRRTERAIKTWLQFKEMYDKGMPVKDIVKTVRKPDGSKYAPQYVYRAFQKLKNI